jgi:hypothetical protein
MTMRLLRIVPALAAFIVGGAAAAEPDTAPHWRTLAQVDVEAAYKLLLEDHPGAATEVGDEAFQRQLASAYAAAKGRAAKVDSYDGYLATLAGFSVSLGDKHIWSRPLYASETRDWAGLIIARRGKDFVVADESEAAEGAPLKGAKLVSCDGISADRLADERLGEFKLVRGIGAQLVQRAWWLLVDDGNPFLKRPQTCQFLQDGQVRAVPLKWRSIARTELSTRLAALPTRGTPGLGVKKAGEGWWISLQSLNERALPVVEEVRSRAAEIRAAPYVVLDLRGNGGGNSRFGRDIASALLGQQYVEAVGGGSEGGEACSKVWRVSDRNLKQLLYYKDELGPRQGKAATEAFAKEYESVAAAKAAGQSFSGKPRCPSSGAKPAKKVTAKPEYSGRIILLTDNACFSSCLLVTKEFRDLGALHVGEPTDANTNYMEVREEKLPSGLSMFSTLQAVSPASPRQIGPFVPEVAFGGNIADTGAIEKWIAGLVSRS